MKQTLTIVFFIFLLILGLGLMLYIGGITTHYLQACGFYGDISRSVGPKDELDTFHIWSTTHYAFSVMGWLSLALYIVTSICLAATLIDHKGNLQEAWRD